MSTDDIAAVLTRRDRIEALIPILLERQREKNRALAEEGTRQAETFARLRKPLSRKPQREDER